MNNETAYWFAFFEEVFEKSKEKLREHYKLEEDGSGPPQLVAYNKAIESLPLGVKVLQLKIDKEKYKGAEDDVIQWIQFDLNKINKLDVEYVGSVEITNENELLEILTAKFGFPKSDAESFLKDYLKELNILSSWDTNKPYYSIFTRKDIKNHKDEFIREFILNFIIFSFGSIVVRHLGLPLERHLTCKLQPERVLTFEELIKRDSPHSPTTSIEKLQELISEIQLMNTVPEHVARTFGNAKELFKFGYFRYNFFTISEHYACLALEAAIKHKYSQNLPKYVELHNKKRTRKYTIEKSDYEKIIEFCRITKTPKKLRPQDAYLNGEKFPYSRHELIRWLLKNKLINIYESKLCEFYLQERNWLSHLFFAPIHTPSNRTLIDVANLINTLFDAQNE